MAPLKNIRHEQFANKILETEGKQGKAYQAVYPDANPTTAVVNASKLLSSANIRERVLELMQEANGPNPNRVIDKLSAHLDSENEGISMDAVKTSLKVFGAFDENKVDASLTAIQVVFGDATPHKEGA